MEHIVNYFSCGVLARNEWIGSGDKESHQPVHGHQHISQRAFFSSIFYPLHFSFGCCKGEKFAQEINILLPYHSICKKGASDELNNYRGGTFLSTERWSQVWYYLVGFGVHQLNNVVSALCNIKVVLTTPQIVLETECQWRFKLLSLMGGKTGDCRVLVLL
jgi:hypothetical protein